MCVCVARNVAVVVDRRTWSDIISRCVCVVLELLLICVCCDVHCFVFVFVCVCVFFMVCC